MKTSAAAKTLEFSFDSTFEQSLSNARQGSTDRLVRVDAGGDVRGYDEIGDTFTLHHGLTATEVATAQDLASKVRAGTHYIAGRRVYEIKAVRAS